MIIGITGGIATGKSTVSAMLQSVGEAHSEPMATISADAIARDLLDPGTPATLAVIERFGPECTIPGQPDSLDRRVVASRIFQDERDRRWLEQLLHPPIIAQLAEAGGPFKGRTALGIAGKGVLLMEIPLLFEKNLEYLVDRILVTYCPEPLQVERIIARRPGTTETDALRQINAQLPLDVKVKKADYVVDTGKDIKNVEGQLEGVFEALSAWRV